MLTIPTTAVALTAGRANALSAAGATPQQALNTVLEPRQIGYGRDLTVTGSAPVTDAGQTLKLEFAPAGSSSWRVVGSTTVGRTGRFRVSAPLRQSGQVRVIGVAGTASDPAATPVLPGAVTAPAGAGTIASPPQHVAVAAALRVPPESLNVLGGQPVDVRGRLLPARAGRKVWLEGRAGRSWQWLATARTGSRGGFDFRYVPGGLGSQELRVRFPGDRHNARVSGPAGWVTGYRQAVASWYDDAGGTACGFHANFGVANRDLPCGTQVTFRYGGRTVTAVVDDRGPYVGGRDWDLNQNTAAALGFNGVDTVWSSI
jgi:hypothetical protein